MRIPLHEQRLREIPREFLTSEEVGRVVGWPSRKALALARRGRLAHVVLPDGNIRFRREDVLAAVKIVPGPSAASPKGGGA